MSDFLREHAIWAFIGYPISMAIMLIALGVMIALQTTRRR